MTFTLGRGNNIVCCAIDAFKFLLENKSVDEIYQDFGGFWRTLTSEPQLRWVSLRLKFIFLKQLNYLKSKLTVRPGKRSHQFSRQRYHLFALGFMGKIREKTRVEIISRHDARSKLIIRFIGALYVPLFSNIMTIENSGSPSLVRSFLAKNVQSLKCILRSELLLLLVLFSFNIQQIFS